MKRKRISPDVITLNANFETKEEILKFMTENLEINKYITDAPSFYKEIIEREKISTTVIGDKIAIPHAQSERVLRPVIAFLRNSYDVLWEESTGSFAQLIFMFGVGKTEEDRIAHLEMLREVAKKLAKKEIVNEIIVCSTVEEFIKIMDI